MKYASRNKHCHTNMYEGETQEARGSVGGAGTGQWPDTCGNDDDQQTEYIKHKRRRRRKP